SLGLWLRNPEDVWRLVADDHASARTRQRLILAAAAVMVRPGGRLVYATCSLEPEENDEVVREFLAAHPGFGVDRPLETPIELDAAGILRCLPHWHGTDGFTAIRFRRAD